ncbi:hypothetical protein BC332_18584 [Capsicum chinense]|nr:hypothetical protein BC332_18584 [Capsicum chinense]
MILALLLPASNAQHGSQAKGALCVNGLCFSQCSYPGTCAVYYGSDFQSQCKGENVKDNHMNDGGYN